MHVLDYRLMNNAIRFGERAIFLSLSLSLPLSPSLSPFLSLSYSVFNLTELLKAVVIVSERSLDSAFLMNIRSTYHLL
jgi:hypothetical protein